MSRTFTPCQIAERSIQKKYRRELWGPFVAAIKRYALIQENDRIAVCISGGKDSMLLAKLMQMLQRISDVPFDLSFLVMDPGYAPANRARIEENAARLEIPIRIFESRIFEVSERMDARKPCYLCAKMRRGYLYHHAQSIGCNKIALGHHFSDVVETTVMGLLYGGQIQAMRPKLHSNNFPGMELIRPLFCVHEEDIIAWRSYNHLEFLQCACRFTEHCATGEGDSKRLEIKQLLRALRANCPQLEKNIFNAIHDVNVDTLLGFNYHGKGPDFLTMFDEEAEKLARLRAGESGEKSAER